MEDGYHARSFEDSFIKKNLDLIKTNRDALWGIKNKEILDTQTDIFELTQNLIDKKSDFASSVLFLALSKDIEWKMPHYIHGGFEWLRK